MNALDRARRLLDQPPPPQVPGQLAADIPTAHTGRVRLYPCGWRCTRHAPRPHQQNGQTT